MSAETYKDCSCGRTFTREAWGVLPYLGVQEDGEGSALELRNCDVCGITLAIEVGLEDPTLRLCPRAVDGTGEACGLFEGHEEVCAPTMRSVA